jgi:hypothetical protein
MSRCTTTTSSLRGKRSPLSSPVGTAEPVPVLVWSFQEVATRVPTKPVDPPRPGPTDLHADRLAVGESRSGLLVLDDGGHDRRIYKRLPELPRRGPAALYRRSTDSFAVDPLAARLRHVLTSTGRSPIAVASEELRPFVRRLFDLLFVGRHPEGLENAVDLSTVSVSREAPLNDERLVARAQQYQVWAASSVDVWESEVVQQHLAGKPKSRGESSTGGSADTNRGLDPYSLDLLKPLVRLSEGGIENVNGDASWNEIHLFAIPSTNPVSTWEPYQPGGTVNVTATGKRSFVVTRPGISLTMSRVCSWREDGSSASLSVCVVAEAASIVVASAGGVSSPEERSASRPAKIPMTATAPTIIQVTPGRMGPVLRLSRPADKCLPGALRAVLRVSPWD